MLGINSHSYHKEVIYMLFKEKIFLSNCDSVREQPINEVRKRMLIGLVFGDGVILSPNIVFDSIGVSSVLEQKNVIKFLNEEGDGNFVIRGLNIKNTKSFAEYFENLPNTYKVSSFNGRTKGELKSTELQTLKDQIHTLDDVIKKVNPRYENASIVTNSLSLEIQKRLFDLEQKKELYGSYFFNNEEYLDFLSKSKKLISRSEWYQFLSDFFKNDLLKINTIKNEIIDPAYNSLFIYSGEGFIQDNIKILDKIPAQILSAGVTFNALRNEIELIKYAYDKFELISTFGQLELAKFITGKAISFIEDEMLSFSSRKNWYGLYPKLATKMGLEVK